MIYMVAALDNPYRGKISVSPDSLERVYLLMIRSENEQAVGWGSCDKGRGTRLREDSCFFEGHGLLASGNARCIGTLFPASSSATIRCRQPDAVGSL